jgi:hypothetical protein
LMAQHGADCLSLCAYDTHLRPAFARASAGFVGVSDGWAGLPGERPDDLDLYPGRRRKRRAHG